MVSQLEKMKNLIQVEENIFVINSPAYPNSNSILIQDEKNTLIDTGAKRKVLKKISKQVDQVINTHFHTDHNRNNDLFHKIKISKTESAGLKNPNGYFETAGVSSSDLKKKLKGVFPADRLWPDKIVPLSKEENLDFGTTQWEIIHTPGHSPGHYCYYEKNRDILIAGDYGPEEFGPWYAWPSSDLNDFVSSVEKIIDLDPRLVLSGHVEPVEGDVSSVMEDYLNMVWERDELISDLYEEGSSVDEILEENIFYSSEAKDSSFVVKYFAKNMISKHIEFHKKD